jgi:hypothetical protein
MVDELIRQAIDGRHVVAFRYRGHRRVGEPHAYGKANGRAQLLVYLTGGSSMAGSYPTWRWCDLDQIGRFTVTSRTFQGVRLNPGGEHSDWDEIWAIVS